MELPLVCLWLIVILSFVRGEDVCRQVNYIDCWKDKRMTGHVIEKIKISTDSGGDPPGVHDCRNKCFYHSQCVACNVGPSRGGIAVCELNAADHWMRNMSFVVTKTGYHYCPIENKCSLKPCSSERLCTPKFDTGGYSCSDGAWSPWSAWGGCINKNQACPQVRKRACDNPKPEYNGADCYGPNTHPKTRYCDFEVPESCYNPLGMQNESISNDQISASNNGQQSHQARLHGNSGWFGDNRPNEWIQVDLLKQMIVTKVATQGHQMFNWYTRQYAVVYSNDGTVWSEGKDCAKTYDGNNDKSSLKINYLVAPIKARYIKLLIKDFEGTPAFRLELYGCSP